MTDWFAEVDRCLAGPATAPMPDRMRIGVGAGFAGDRAEPARLLARFGKLDALVFECLAERTIGLAHARVRSGKSGFDPRIVDRLQQSFPLLEPGAVVTTNAGAADPIGAAAAVREALDGHGRPRVAAVTGDSVLGRLDRGATRIWDSDLTLADLGERVISVNVYLGASPIVEAMDDGADIVITGRCGDAALFAAPLIARFGWAFDDVQLLAAGTLVGHLLECGAQLTGGYFADPGVKDVPDLWKVGFPFADVRADGEAIYATLPGAGGRLDRATVLEQLLYEIDDPEGYRTPDVTLDLTHVDIDEMPDGRVRVAGARGAAPPETLKASVAVDDGYAAVAEIAYAGPHCMDRARLAAEIVTTRWRRIHGLPGVPEVALVGANSTRAWSTATGTPSEVRLRMSVRALDERTARTLCDEVEGLYTNGPAAGGGVTGVVSRSIGVVSVAVPRDVVEATVTFP